MKHVICSIYDSATQAYMRPWTAQTKGQAHRLFVDEVKREGSELGQHPEDYALFQIGTFDDNTGELSQPEIKCIQRAHDIITDKE